MKLHSDFLQSQFHFFSGLIQYRPNPIFPILQKLNLLDTELLYNVIIKIRYQRIAESRIKAGSGSIRDPDSRTPEHFMSPSVLYYILHTLYYFLEIFSIGPRLYFFGWCWKSHRRIHCTNHNNYLQSWTCKWTTFSYRRGRKAVPSDNSPEA